MRLKSTFAVTSVVSLSSEHDECLSGLHNCDENALCFNMVGGHSCSCKPGYTGNGTVCKGKHHHVDSVICCVMLIQVPKQDIKNAVAVVNHVRRELTLHWKQIFLSSVSGSTIKSDTKNKTKTKTQFIQYYPSEINLICTFDSLCRPGQVEESSFDLSFPVKRCSGKIATANPSLGMECTLVHLLNYRIYCTVFATLYFQSNTFWWQIL